MLETRDSIDMRALVEGSCVSGVAGTRAALFWGRLSLSLSRGACDFTSAHVSRLSRVFTDTALSTLQSPPLSA